jgi:hypothetical protein
MLRGGRFPLDFLFAQATAATPGLQSDLTRNGFKTQSSMAHNAQAHQRAPQARVRCSTGLGQARRSTFLAVRWKYPEFWMLRFHLFVTLSRIRASFGNLIVSITDAQPSSRQCLGIEGQLQSHVPAGGGADDVRSVFPELAPERPTVGGPRRDADRDPPHGCCLHSRRHGS